MRKITTFELTELLADQASPCISLFQPTHRHYPDKHQDPIRYRNLLKKMENSLHMKYPEQQIQTLVAKFHALARDTHFWNNRTDGLAILGSPDKFQVFDLQRSVSELVVVADSFHIKPLLRIFQSSDRYQILCLNRQEVKLYEGNRDTLDLVKLENVPATIIEALGEELSEPHLTVASYGDGAGAMRAPHGEPRMYHGHGAKKDEVDIDIERFFRVIDRAIWEHHSRPSGLPLMLATLPEYHAPFHLISHNPHLMKDGIMINPAALTADELRAEAWRVIEPMYLQRLAKAVADFQLALSRKLASDNLAEVVKATTNGRVAVLLVEADLQIPGRINQTTESIELGELTHPEFGDILDDLAETVLQKKGEVIIVPRQRMPSNTGVAATYRF